MINLDKIAEHEWTQNDLESTLDALRRIKKAAYYEIFQKQLSLTETFFELSQVADFILKKATAYFFQELAGAQAPQGSYLVIGMGKYGGYEINAHSDLDLIFIYENPNDQAFYTKLAQRLIFGLTTFTREGFAYKIDMELRPSGNSGALVSSIKSFEEYHQTSQNWEKQALIKSRVVVFESLALKEHFEKIRFSTSFGKFDPQQLAQEMSVMRLRMEKEISGEKPGVYNIKLGPGGIVDIEFMIQYLQMLHAGEIPELRSTNTLEALEVLKTRKILDSDLAKILHDAYLFLRQLEMKLRTLLDQATSLLFEKGDVLKRIESESGKPILEDFLGYRKKVREIYEATLKK